MRLSATSLKVCECVIRGMIENTGLIYLGDETVDSTGYPLQAGEPFRIADLQRVRIAPIKNEPFIDLYDVWIDAEVNGEGVNFAYIARF